MSDATTAAIITGMLAVLAEVLIAIINNRSMMSKLEKQSELADERLDKQSQLADARLEKSQAITDTRLDELTREVRAHNNFAQRMPVLEEQLKVANHRIEDLEKKVS